MLKLDRISSTISRSKYVTPAVAYTELDTAHYLSSLYLPLSLSYCIHLARDDEYLTCVQFTFAPDSARYRPVSSVLVPVMRSGDTIAVRIEAEEPGVAVIAAEVEYTQHTQHYRASLPALRVELNDLLCQLPLSNFTPALVFARLWEHCEQHQKCAGAGDAVVSKLKPADGYRMKLSAFRLPDTANERSAGYMFGLPPNHFVLVACAPEFLSMRIAVDSWRVFPVVHKLLTASNEL